MLTREASGSPSQMSLDSLQMFIVLSKCQSLALVFSLILVLHLMSASAGLQVVVWAGAELISIMRTGLNKHQTPDQRKCQRNFTEHNECQARHISSKTPFYCESVFKLICQWQFNYQISITIQILVAFNKDNVNIVNCENYREMLLAPSQTSHTSLRLCLLYHKANMMHTSTQTLHFLFFIYCFQPQAERQSFSTSIIGEISVKMFKSRSCTLHQAPTSICEQIYSKLGIDNSILDTK